MNMNVVVASCCATLIIAGPAAAHHSGAMFEPQKQITVEGTVKQWQFTAPHSWLIVSAKQPDGKVVDWAFEGGGPSGPLRKDTFNVGDKVKVETHPMKDGRLAGSLGVVTFADGRKANDRPPL